MPEQKAKFNLLEKAEEITDDKGNYVIVSKQEIVQPNDSKTLHIVISKIRRNVDGTQQGNAKSIFIPVAMAPYVTKTINSLVK